MREGQEGDVDIKDVRKPVFQALLYFTYTDQLPEVGNFYILSPMGQNSRLCYHQLLLKWPSKAVSVQCPRMSADSLYIGS